MTTYVALLRGVNVSGKKPLRMAELQVSCLALGLQNVRTYLQSGNLVFDTKQTDTRKLASILTAMIAKKFKHDVDVLVLSARALNRIAATNPLRPPSSGDAQTHFHATFLFEPTPAYRFGKLTLPARPNEKAALKGQVVLLYCPNGYGKTKLNNNFFERALRVVATTRNWRTVVALRNLCAEH
jgi:uncharacterized protein (DUF1697 family)